MNFYTEQVTRNPAIDAATVTVYMDTEVLEVLDLAMAAAQYIGPDFHGHDGPEKRAFGLLAGAVTALIFACRPASLSDVDVERGVQAPGMSDFPLFLPEEMHRREDGQLRGVSVRMNYKTLETLDIVLAVARFGGPMLYVPEGDRAGAILQLEGSIRGLLGWVLSEKSGAADVAELAGSTPAAQDGKLDDGRAFTCSVAQDAAACNG